MKKGWVLAGITFLLMPCLLAGCGINEEEHALVLSQLSTAQVDLETSKAQISELTAKIDATETKLTTALASLSATEAELEKAKADNLSLISDLDNNKTLLAEALVTKDELETTNEDLTSEISAIKERIPAPVYETYTNNKVGFSIDYPKGWDIAIDLFIDGQGLLTIMDPISNSNVVVSHEILLQPLSVQDYFDTTVEQMTELDLGYSVGCVKEFSFNGVPAIQCIAIREDTAQIIVFLVDEEDAWTIVSTSSADDFVYRVHTFYEVINSFQIFNIII